MGLRLASVIRIRNEIDIVEPLIRHHAAYFDCMLVLDEGSVDGSYELLCALRDEGLPIVLEQTVSVGDRQAENVTRLTSLAVNHYAADWVIPLDADEFIEPPSGLSLKDVLADCPAEVHKVGWSGFLWNRDSDEKTDISPVFRLTDRLPARRDLSKVIIPAAVVRRDNFWVEIGNHDVWTCGAVASATLFSGFELCHYPIRSRAQFIGKVVINYLQLRASPVYAPGQGHQYDQIFPLIGKNIDNITATMEESSLRYSVEPQNSIDERPRHAPLRYVGGPLTHQVEGAQWVGNILAFAKDMALRFASQKREGAAIADALSAMTSHMVGASPLDRVHALQQLIHASDGARADFESRLSDVQAELSGSVVLAEQWKTRCETLEEASRRDDERVRVAMQEVAQITASNGELQAHCTGLGERLSEAESGLSRAQGIAEKQAADLSRRLVRFALWLSRR